MCCIFGLNCCLEEIKKDKSGTEKGLCVVKVVW